MIHPPPTARTWVLACLHICACMYECITHKSLALGLAPFIFFFLLYHTMFHFIFFLVYFLNQLYIFECYDLLRFFLITSVVAYNASVA